MSDSPAGFSQNEKLHQTELTSDAAVRYGDLYAIAQDLTFVIACCERMLAAVKQPEDRRDGVVSRALWTSALIAYERVFAGGVRERLTQQHVRAVPNEGAEAVSDHYRSMRDRHIAHSVNPHEMSKVCAVVSPPAAMSREVVAISVLHVQLVGFTENDARQLGASLRPSSVSRWPNPLKYSKLPYSRRPKPSGCVIYSPNLLRLLLSLVRSTSTPVDGSTAPM